METIEIGLDKHQREKIVAKLGQVLGNQHVLYIKLRNFHWNLVGARFRSLHQFFEEQ